MTTWKQNNIAIKSALGGRIWHDTFFFCQASDCVPFTVNWVWIANIWLCRQTSLTALKIVLNVKRPWHVCFSLVLVHFIWPHLWWILPVFQWSWIWFSIWGVTQVSFLSPYLECWFLLPVFFFSISLSCWYIFIILTPILTFKLNVLLQIEDLSLIFLSQPISIWSRPDGPHAHTHRFLVHCTYAGRNDFCSRCAGEKQKQRSDTMSC